MNKVKQYMPALFGLVALVILLLTSGRADAPAGTEPPATEPTGQTSEQTAGFPELTEPLEMPAKDAMTRVEQALDKYRLDETAMAACVYNSDLHAGESTIGMGKDANAHALANICDEQRMNPVAAFWLLAEQKLYAYAPDPDEYINVPAFAMSLQSRKEYPFTAEGSRELLTDILTLAGSVEDGMDLESRLLGENKAVDGGQVFREEGDCFYAYFVYYGERSAHFLCFYTRGSEKIDELEFQLLNLRYAKGDEEQLRRIDQLGDRQAASLMAAAEQLLTGSSRADEGRIALSYVIDGYDIAAKRFDILGYDETGSLVNFAISKKG